jgi:hypothetical protein
LITERHVSEDVAVEYFTQQDIGYIETSSKDAFQVDTLFQFAAMTALSKMQEKTYSSIDGRAKYQPKKQIPLTTFELSSNRIQELFKPTKQELKANLTDVIKRLIKEKFGELDAYGFPIGGEYSGSMDPQRVHLRKKLLKTTKDLNDMKLDGFITVIKSMGLAAQKHHETESGFLLFRNFTTCRFKKHVDSIVAYYEAANKDLHPQLKN